MMRKRISWPLALVIAVLLVTALGWYTVRRLTELPGETIATLARESGQNATRVRDALADIFHLRPNVVTHSEVKIDPKTSPVSQLALASREVEVSRETSATWWGSTKSLRVRSTYRVQAGFDLGKGLSVEVTGRQVQVKVPHAEILTVEPLETHVDELTDGLWNRVQASDVQAELVALPEAARAQAADLPNAAEETFQNALRDRLTPAGLDVQIKFNDTPATPGTR
ncbi:MAG: DUF4230 domain-containing protein [Verrucomicrobia bacterium]|nr:DUF4230 domain-containing protein [Verrucomicrobiota bacterium]